RERMSILIVTTGSTSVHVGRAADNADRSVRLLAAFVLVSLTSVAAVQAQTGRLPVSQTSGSVPTGTATNDVRHLTLRDTIEMALRYNLGAIESGETARAARGQRLQALSALLPQV